MRGISWLLPIFLGLCGIAEAQQSPAWDVGVTIGTIGVSPQTPQQTYSDDWYFDGRYALSIGKYWTEHIKTEVEFAHSGEGSRYVQQLIDMPGVPPHYSVPGEEHNRLQQLSARVFYQFFDNAWVHPYVFGGAGVDINRRRTDIPPNYFYPPVTPGGRPNPILVTPQRVEGPDTSWRPAAVFGTGAKIYMTPRSFFNAAAIGTVGKRLGTVSLIAGFGIDF
ncbi:MAG TPA: outer membrane beta-barrel protein [Vicinamibacterales bacterium]